VSSSAVDVIVSNTSQNPNGLVAAYGFNQGSGVQVARTQRRRAEERTSGTALGWSRDEERPAEACRRASTVRARNVTSHGIPRPDRDPAPWSRCPD